MLQAALEYLSFGWPVIPLKSKKDQLLPSWKPYQERLPTEEEVRAWWTAWPDAWIGLVLGEASGIVRLDADGPVPPELLEGFDCTAEFKSPNGRGWLFQYNPAFTEGRHAFWTGSGSHEELRYQSNGCYTVLPPSPGYEWVRNNVEPIPQKLCDTLLSLETAKALKELEREYAPSSAVPEPSVMLEALAFVPADDRDTWLKVGFALHSVGNEYLEKWVVWSRSSEKFVEGECERLWGAFKPNGGITARYITHLARRHGWYNPKFHEPLTDVGNGRVLARTMMGRILYCREWNRWLAWNGEKWLEDGQLIVELAAKNAIRERYEKTISSALKALLIQDPARRKDKEEKIKKVLGWCKKSEEAKHVFASIDMAKSEPGMNASFRELNRHPWLLNCANGVLDLKSGELLPHDADLRMTQQCPTEYHEKAVCPRWEQFLQEVFDGDNELVLTMQRLLGYCITGVVQDHVLPIFHGSGRNGKSTIARALLYILGPDYCCTAPSGFLALSKNEQHPTKLVLLYGKRLVFDVETGDSTRLNEEMVKRLTGGDNVTARKMYENFWEFEPTHKILLLTNHEPTVKGSDTAVWSRLKKWPFAVSFEGREEPGLDASLKAEAQGILAWMVRGCFEWQEKGLGESKAVKAATSAYQAEQDIIAQFAAMCLTADLNGKIRVDELVKLYINWCVNNGHRPANTQTFGRRMTNMGYILDENRKFRLGIVPAKG